MKLKKQKQETEMKQEMNKEAQKQITNETETNKQI
jgi:hypothetical protein